MNITNLVPVVGPGISTHALDLQLEIVEDLATQNFCQSSFSSKPWGKIGRGEKESSWPNEYLGNESRHEPSSVIY